MTSLSVPRSHAGLVNIHGQLYLVGGRSPDGNGKVVSVDSIEQYDEDEDEWRPFAKLRTARHDAACTAVGQSAACVATHVSMKILQWSSTTCSQSFSGTKIRKSVNAMTRPWFKVLAS